MTPQMPQNQPHHDETRRVFIGLLLMALAAGAVLFVIAVFFGVASPD